MGRQTNLCWLLAPDLNLFQASELSPEEAIRLKRRLGKCRIKQTFAQNTEAVALMGTTFVLVTPMALQSYCSSRYSMSSCVIAEQNSEMERDYALYDWRSLGHYSRLSGWAGVCSSYFVSFIAT